jgi:hypothetical protein
MTKISTNDFGSIYNHHRHTAATPVGSIRPRLQHTSGRLGMHLSKNNNNNNSNKNQNQKQRFTSFSLLESTTFKSVILYPLLIIGVVPLLLPSTSFIIVFVLYIGFAFLGQQFILKDIEEEKIMDSNSCDKHEDYNDDPPPVFLLSFLVSVICGGILTPIGSLNGSGIIDNNPFSEYLPYFVVIVSLLITILVQQQGNNVIDSVLSLPSKKKSDDDDKHTIQEEEIPIEKQMMNLWDKRFKKETEKDNNKNNV